MKCKQSSDHQSRVLSIDSVAQGPLKRFISCGPWKAAVLATIPPTPIVRAFGKKESPYSGITAQS